MTTTSGNDFDVKIGFDVDKNSGQQATRTIDEIRSAVVRFGAVAASASSMNALTFGKAEELDALGKFSRSYKLAAKEVYALGEALEHEGGDSNAITGYLSDIDKLRAGLKKGDADFVTRMEIAGIDSRAISQTTNSIDALMALADEFQGLSLDDKINAKESLGLDDAMVRLLSKGSDGLRKDIDREINIRDIGDNMTKEAADFNDAYQDMANSFSSIGDGVAMKFMPIMTKGMIEITDLVIEFKDELNEITPILMGIGAVLAGSVMLGTLSKIRKVTKGISGDLGGIKAPKESAPSENTEEKGKGKKKKKKRGKRGGRGGGKRKRGGGSDCCCCGVQGSPLADKIGRGGIAGIPLLIGAEIGSTLAPLLGEAMDKSGVSEFISNAVIGTGALGDRVELTADPSKTKNQQPSAPAPSEPSTDPKKSSDIILNITLGSESMRKEIKNFYDQQQLAATQSIKGSSS